MDIRNKELLRFAFVEVEILAGLGLAWHFWRISRKFEFGLSMTKSQFCMDLIVNEMIGFKVGLSWVKI
jgi:hypothetical protein